jgi:ParB family transcriptional regulator, chromosome partitioning protein
VRDDGRASSRASGTAAQSEGWLKVDIRKRGLGKGLGALIPGASAKPTATPSTAETGQEIPLSSIVPSPFQPRQDFVEEPLEQLVSSIRQNGVLQPLIVRRRETGYELIAGERRWRAAQRAGLERVPVIVRQVSDREALELALIENIQRENLNPLDEATAYRRLMEEFQLTQEAVAERVAKSRSAVANSLRLLALPDVVKLEIRAGRLSGGHARAIAGSGDAQAQERVAAEVVKRRLNVRETEKLVRDRGQRPDADQAAVEERLRRALGTKVRLHTRAGGAGSIEIQYFSLDELQGLLQRLGC